MIHQEMVRAGAQDWTDMADKEIELAVRKIVISSHSEDEVHRRIREELKYDGSVAISSHVPKDETGEEARAIVRALGGPMMANGAMVMLMMHGHGSIIRL